MNQMMTYPSSTNEPNETSYEIWISNLIALKDAGRPVILEIFSVVNALQTDS
jgi:hypothetical protein